MRFDFDREINRRHTNSLKYDFAEAFRRPADALPLWVADMDFQAPPAARKALMNAAEHGIFGYSDVKDDYYDAVTAWFKSRFGWEAEKEWIVKTPGVVTALAMAVRALTAPGDTVMIQPPVYYPFFSVVRENGRRLTENRLRLVNGRYEMDFDDFERRVRKENVKMVILCSPHNPVCRVWREEELRTVGAICERYGVYVVSDEIHCDFAFPDHPHRVFHSVCPELGERTVVCTAPSKTFNLAGLQVSHIFIPGGDTREKFRAELRRCGLDGLNAMGLAAAKAAYEEGGEWLAACKEYIGGNLNFLRAELAQNVPEIRLVEPEGTYFAWLDCSALGFGDDALEDFILNRAKLWLDGGRLFGGGAEQFQRIVLACTRKTLAEAMERLKRAVRAERQR